jgi:hypothetical protein
MRPILGALTATDKALLGVPPTSSDASPIVGPSESLARANPADHWEVMPVYARNLLIAIEVFCLLSRKPARSMRTVTVAVV